MTTKVKDRSYIYTSNDRSGCMCVHAHYSVYLYLQGMSLLRSLIPFTPPSVHASIVQENNTLDRILQLFIPAIHR